MFVIYGSSNFINSTKSPLGEITDIPPVNRVPTQIFPFFSTASESNLLIPPSLFNNLPPLIECGNWILLISPSPIISNPYNLPPSVSAT